MENKLQLIRRSDLITGTWSGGTTTQLFIYPPDAEYAQRNFIFRISTATVVAERSDFTPLPGFHRKLMVLEGSLHIYHKDRYSKQLKKFEQDSFEGSWQTSAEGKGTDFNLMTAAGAKGTLEPIAMESGALTALEVREKCFIYVYKGRIRFNGEEGSAGDVVCIEDPGELIISAMERSELVITSVSLGV